MAGAYKMLLARKAGTDIFNQSKNLALWGLGVALALYLIGFMVIGAEWFAMWQSQRWDGRQPAFRILMCIGIIILIVLQDDNKRVGQLDLRATDTPTLLNREGAAAPSNLTAES